jgi:hypothetical protein
MILLRLLADVDVDASPPVVDLQKMFDFVRGSKSELVVDVRSIGKEWQRGLSEASRRITQGV